MRRNSDRVNKNGDNFESDNTDQWEKENEAFANEDLEDKTVVNGDQEDKLNADSFGQETVGQYGKEYGTFELSALENDGQRKRADSISGTNNSILEKPEVYQSRWRSIRVMYYTMFVSNVSLTIFFSSMYPYLKILDKTVTTEFLGWTVAAYSLGQLVAAPTFGAWSNFRGKAKEPLVVSLMIEMPANVLYMYLESIHTGSKIFMVVSRTLVGIGSGNMSVVRSYVSGATTLEERTSAMANMSAFQAIGFIMGPLLQSAMVPISYPGFVNTASLHLHMYTFPAFLCVILDVINLALLIFVFREHRVPDDMGTEDEGDTCTHGPDAAAAAAADDADRPIDYVAAISTIALFFSVMFTFIIIETILTPLCMHMFSWTKAKATLFVGIILGVAGVVGVVVFVSIKFLSKRLNERYILLSGFVLFLVGYFIFLPWGHKYPDILLSDENTTSNQSSKESTGCPDIHQWCFETPAILLGQFLLGCIFISVGYPACYVICFTLYSKILGPKPQGVWMGWVTAAGSLARALGPVSVSVVYDATGPRVTFSAILGFIVLSIVGLLIVFRRLVPFAMRKPKAEDKMVLKSHEEKCQ